MLIGEGWLDLTPLLKKLRTTIKVHIDLSRPAPSAGSRRLNMRGAKASPVESAGEAARMEGRQGGVVVVVVGVFR